MNAAHRSDSATLWFGSGRQALFALFSALAERGTAAIWLPEYHCMSMVTPCAAARVEARFYRLTGELEPRLDSFRDLAAGDAVVAVHYFGRAYDFAPLARLCAERRARLVEDAAHVDWAAEPLQASAVGSFGDFVLHCPRKFTALYDGAVLRGERATLGTIQQTPPSWREQAKGVLALTRLGRKRAGVVEPAPAAPAAPAPAGYVEPRFTVTARHRATVASRAAQALGLGRARRLPRRLARFAELHRALGASRAARPLFPAVPAPLTPYVFPAVLADPDDFGWLRRHGIDALRWEELAAEPSSEIAALRWSLVQLPCTDAMAQREFDRLLALLRELSDRPSGRA